MERIEKSRSRRIIATPSPYSKEHYLYVQEVGTLTSIEPHISQRQNLSSFLFMVITDGEGTLTYKGVTRTIKAGDCVWIDCRESYSHESSTHNPWTLMWVHFYGRTAPDFYKYYLEQEFQYIFTPRNISVFTDCLTFLYQIQENREAFMELNANKCLTDIITFCFIENSPASWKDNSIHDKLRQIRNYIEMHSGEKIDLDILSSQFFISKFHLSREFHKAFGITVSSEITNKRISHAKSMLRFTNSSVEEIGNACGFGDAGYFIKVFKKMENLTPLEYRKKW